MKQETIWNLEDLLENAKNEQLDLEIDLKNPELRNIKHLKQDCLRIVEEKINELNNCINWLNNL